MSFETPGALWGLLSLALLAIFSLWRQAAVRTVVPSLLLWKLVPERNPPLRALRRPAWRWELLLQALALALLVAGLAGPFRETQVPRPRRVALVADTSARMAAGGRLEKIRSRIADLLAGPLRFDDVWIHAADPAPQRFRDPAGLRQGGGHVDVGTLLAAARASSELVVLFSDRAPEGVVAELFGGPPGNAGITGLTASDGELFARLANHGAGRQIVIRVNGERETIALPSGERGWSRKGDFSKLDRIDVELEGDDGFDVDDRAGALRLASPRTEVAVRGLVVPLLDRALAAIPGVVLRGDGARSAVAVGVDEEPGAGEVRVRLRPPQPRREGLTVELRPHPLTRGIRREELASAGVGELPPGGEVLALAGGVPVLAIQGGVVEVAVSFDPGRWPSTPSWPIFWTNVIDFARKGAPGFVVPKVGEPLGVPADVGRAGEIELMLPGGARKGLVGLLDARETDVAGATRPLEADLGAESGRERGRRPLAAWAALGALACLAAAWVLQRRGGD